MTLRWVVLVVAVLAVVGVVVWLVGAPGKDDGGVEAGERAGIGAETAPMLEGRSVVAPTVAPPAPPAPSEVAAPAGRSATGYVIEGVVRDLATQWQIVDAQVRGRVMEGGLSASFSFREVLPTRSEDGSFRFVMDNYGLPELSLVNADWQLLKVHWERGAEAPMDARQGATVRVVLWARRAFRLKGVVLDRQGKPLPGAQLTCGMPLARGETWVHSVASGSSDAQGRFDIGPFAIDPALGLDPKQAAHMAENACITFKHEGLAPFRLEPASVPASDRERVVVTMTPGITLAGVLLDAAGRPLAGQVVAVEYAAIWELRSGTRTDAGGRWRLERLPPGRATLLARAFDHDAKARRDMTLSEDDLDVRLVAEPIRLSKPPPRVGVLGLDLADVDDELRKAYELPDYVHVVVLDAGREPERLGIGRLAKGYGVWILDEAPVQSVRDLLDRLTAPPASGRRESPLGRRIVYTLWDENMFGTNTQYLSLSKDQVEALRAVRAGLDR